MKLQMGLVWCGLLMIAFPGGAYAGPGHSHGHAADGAGQHDETLHSMSKEQLLDKLHTVMGQIEAAVSARDAAALHDLTGVLPHVATHLAEKAEGVLRVRAEGSARNISALADKLHAEADKGDFEAAASTSKKLSGMVDYFKVQLG